MKKFLTAVFLIFAFASSANAELSIDITGARSEPMAVALPVFSSFDRKSADFSHKITDVIQSDLESSGLFRILDSFSYLQRFKGIDDSPKFVDWQAISAEALIQGAVEYVNAKQIKISVRLWDVPASQEMYSSSFEIDENGWR